MQLTRCPCPSRTFHSSFFSSSFSFSFSVEPPSSSVFLLLLHFLLYAPLPTFYKSACRTKNKVNAEASSFVCAATKRRKSGRKKLSTGRPNARKRVLLCYFHDVQWNGSRTGVDRRKQPIHEHSKRTKKKREEKQRKRKKETEGRTGILE